MVKNDRTIRELKVLATKKSSDVTNYDFRSLQEIQTYIKNIGDEINTLWTKWLSNKKVLATHSKIVTATRIIDLTPPTSQAKSVKFIPPDLKKLSAAFNIIDELQEKVESLDAVINTLQIQFRGTKGIAPAVKTVTDLRKATKKKLDDAYKTLKEIAKSHQPESFAIICDNIVSYISTMFKNDYESYDQVSYMIPDPHDESQIIINRYVHFKNFISDNEFVHPNYYVVFSCVINLKRSSKSMYVNTFSTFVAPGRFHLGAPITDKTYGIEVTLNLLASDNFKALTERQAITPSMLSKLNWNESPVVKEVNVEESVITVVFKQRVAQKEMDDVANLVRRDLLTNLRTVFPKMKVVNKRPYTYKGSYKAMDFAITIPSDRDIRSVKIDARRAKILQDHLNLNDKQVLQLLKSISVTAGDY